MKNVTICPFVSTHWTYRETDRHTDGQNWKKIALCVNCMLARDKKEQRDLDQLRNALLTRIRSMSYYCLSLHFLFGVSTELFLKQIICTVMMVSILCVIILVLLYGNINLR